MVLDFAPRESRYTAGMSDEAPPEAERGPLPDCDEEAGRARNGERKLSLLPALLEVLGGCGLALRLLKLPLLGSVGAAVEARGSSDGGVWDWGPE